MGISNRYINHPITVYKEFGDVITFDSTYLTNKYDMPFAAFVGVNHHGQSILFGCGLISNEDIETYVWLFNSWLTCMFYRAPMAIITDQDKAMQKAIEIVFANARHRWCLWHIMKKLPKKLRRYKQYEEIKFALQNIVYDSLTNSDFENRWNHFIEKYDLHSNEWLLGLYDERQRWVPTFLKDTFWAGMSTTQRSESMHAFFDGFVNSKTTLKQFVEKYENALRDKVEKENHADFSFLNSQIPCMTHYPIEKQFQDTYTKEKFREFQHELSTKLYCEASLKKENVPYLEFTVAENVKVGNNIPTVDFTIWLNEAECEINCICRLFEFKGILCRHVIAVLIHKKIFCVPSKYILRRWRKDVNRCHTKVNIGYDNWNTKPEGLRFDKMNNSFHELAKWAASSDEKCNTVMEVINELKIKLSPKESVDGINHPGNKTNDDTRNYTKFHGTSEENNNIQSPQAVRCKGRPPFKRKQSKIEQIVRKRKQTKSRMKSHGLNTMKDFEIGETELATGSGGIISASNCKGQRCATQESSLKKDSEVPQVIHGKVEETFFDSGLLDPFYQIDGQWNNMNNTTNLQDSEFPQVLHENLEETVFHRGLFDPLYQVDEQ